MAIDVILKVLSSLLRTLADKIDSGNSNLTKTEASELIETISHYTNREEPISKYEACTYLRISRATFDNYVRVGKLPKGKKRIGFTELSYTKKELDEALKNLKTKKQCVQAVTADMK